ncbi:replication initiation protein [Marinomonas sp. A79]|uniref:Replication initiation protein n=2 Tax=Marinomonas vulgaris TaxID=2823372 RepID=A0ABS5HF28_9GAMM|nr:replication initiation protein [Marinomonas vulgaris]
MTGLQISQLKNAIQSRFIQPNGPTHKYWLVFDVDSSTATLDWYDQHAPAPNIVATNPFNGHAHLFYGLAVPVRTAPDGKPAPLRYAAAIESALRENLDADVGYKGLVCKNPLNAHWRVTQWEKNLYTLDWLADCLDLRDHPIKQHQYGLGRNCELFDLLSRWARRAIRQGWPSYDQFLQACHDRAMGYNAQHFPNNLLPLNEVRHTARSVAKWTHAKITPEGFSAWQSIQGSKGGKKSKGGGRKACSSSVRQVKPWENIGISKATYYRNKQKTTG